MLCVVCVLLVGGVEGDWLVLCCLFVESSGVGSEVVEVSDLV